MPTVNAAPGDELRGQTPALILKALCGRGATGSLAVHTRGIKLTALLENGQPVFATSTDREDRLSSILIREHFVALPALEKAIERMLKGRLRLGEVLVADGELSESTLRAALCAQTLAILCRMLAPGHDRCVFGETKVDCEDIGFKFPVNSLIREACNRTNGFYSILDQIGGLASTYMPSADFDAQVKTCGLGPVETDALTIFDRPISLRQACARSVLEDYELCRLIWILLTVGALTRLE